MADFTTTCTAAREESFRLKCLRYVNQHFVDGVEHLVISVNEHSTTIAAFDSGRCIRNDREDGPPSKPIPPEIASMFMFSDALMINTPLNQRMAMALLIAQVQQRYLDVLFNERELWEKEWEKKQAMEEFRDAYKTIIEPRL